MLKFVLKSLRCSKMEKLFQSILFVSEVSNINLRRIDVDNSLYICRIHQRLLSILVQFMVVEGAFSEPKHWYIICEKGW